jgi:hypothetical protein
LPANQTLKTRKKCWLWGRLHVRFRIRFSVRLPIRFHANPIEIRFSVRHEKGASTRTHPILCPIPCCPVGRLVRMCFLKFDASRKNKFVNNFGDRGRLVSEGKSDRQSDGDPICMQIGRRIGWGSDLHAHRTENRMQKRTCRRPLSLVSKIVLRSHAHILVSLLPFTCCAQEQTHSPKLNDHLSGIPGFGGEKRGQNQRRAIPWQQKGCRRFSLHLSPYDETPLLSFISSTAAARS